VGDTYAQTIGTTPSGEVLRVAFDLTSAPVGDDGVPMRLQIVPPGDSVEARDGRTFSITKPDAAIAASEVPALIDWEHRSEFGMFGSSEAAGWIKAFRYDPFAGMVAEVEKWTPKGAEAVKTGAYRFLSPVLLLNKETREVERVISVALTNTPALRLEAIDQFRTALSRGGVHFTDGDSMISKELCAVLGVPEGADEAAIKAAFAAQGEKLAAAEAERVALSAKLDAFETASKARDAADLERDAKATLDKFCAEGRLTPAERDVWAEQCGTREGLAFATKALSARSPVVNATPEPKGKPENFDRDLTDEEIAICARVGVSVDSYKKTRAPKVVRGHEEN
jgi:phage I-like protein